MPATDSTTTHTAPILAAIADLRDTGGLVVVEAGPGEGTTHALAATAGACREARWRVVGDEVEPVAHLCRTTDGPPPGAIVFADAIGWPAEWPERAVLVTSVAAGLPWPSHLRSEAGRLLDSSRLRIVRLPRLTASDTAVLLRNLAPDLSEADVERWSDLSAGVPLVATHLAQHDVVGAPPDLDAVLVSRLLDRYGPVARSVATALVVLGPVTLDEIALVAQVAEIEASAAAAGFDLLVAAGLASSGSEASPVGASGFALAVPWLGQALYSGLGPATRDRAHRVAAASLAGRTPTDHDRVAHHLLRSTTTAEEADISRLLTVADRLVTATPEIALDCYRRALEHVDGPPERVAELTARLARASLLAGRPEETVDLGRALLDDPDSGSAEAYPWLLPVVTEAMKATSAVEEAESILRSTAGGIDGSVDESVDELLDSQAAYLFAASGRDADAQIRIRRARASLPKRSIRGQVNMLSNLLHAQCLAGNFPGLREDAILLTDIIDQAPDETRLHAWATLAHVRSVEGELAASARAASHAEELLRGETWGIYVPGVRYARAAVGFADGHWDQALRIATMADEPLAQSGTVSYLHLMRHVRARILANRGEFTDARRMGGTSIPAPEFIKAMRTLTLAEIELLEGDAATSTDRLRSALDRDDLPGEVRGGVMAMLASAAAVLSDRTTVRDCVSEVDRRSGIGVASRQVRLELQLAQARVEHSPELARAVLSEATEHGFKLFEGRALLTLGCLDVDAEAALTGAMSVFGDLNAVPWRRTTATELRERGLRVPRRPRTSADSLTETEVQLARLVQAARSNKEIAEVMSLSVKTVEVYLSRLYVKAGCKNRLDLARAADDGRLPLG